MNNNNLSEQATSLLQRRLVASSGKEIILLGFRLYGRNDSAGANYKSASAKKSCYLDSGSTAGMTQLEQTTSLLQPRLPQG